MKPPAENGVTITVGPDSGDVRGRDGRAIQIAIDAVAYRDGGTVRVAAGEYELTDAIRLRSDVRLIGEGDGTILRRRGPLVWSELACDADVGQRQISPVHPERFAPGMGVCAWDRAEGWGYSSLPLTVAGARDGILYLDDYITLDRRAEHEGRVVNWFPMILAVESPRVHVEGFTLDAKVEDPQNVLQGMRSAALYLFRCPDSTIRCIRETGNAGDGLCIGKTSERTVFEDCEAAFNGYYGIHPGSHSAGACVRRCHIHHNGFDGLYICWGIHHGEFTDNDIHDNGGIGFRSGISIGHKDTDNILARNRIYRNKKFGICFREKTEANGAHRNVVRGNTIEDNGSAPEEFAALKAKLESWEAVGCGVNVRGVTHDLTFENNVIRETRVGAARTQRHGLWFMGGVSRVRLSGNTIVGHPDGDVRDDAGAVIA